MAESVDIQVNDYKAELGVIGSLLVNNEYMLKSIYLKPKHFYYKENASIFHSMQRLIDSGVTEFDTFSLLTQIEASKGMRAHFDKAKIKDIASYIEDTKDISRDDYKEYELLVKRVMTLAFKRQTKSKLKSIINECDNDNNDELNKFNYKLQSEVSSIANDYLFDNDTPLLADTVRETWDKIVSQRCEDGNVGIPSKYSSINKHFTYRKKGLVVIGARAKAGKSVFVSNEVYHKLQNGVKCAIFDTELSDEDWLPRFLAEITELTINQIESGRYDDVSAGKIESAIQWIESGTLVHLYDPEWTMDKIYARAKQIKIEHGLDLLVYDYIKADDVELNGMAEHTYLGKLTSFLKNKVAGELDLAVIAPAQMNDNELRLADSRKIQRYASVICYWMEKDYDMVGKDGNDEGTHYIYIDFNRHGKKHKSDSKGNAMTYLNFVMDGDRALISMAKLPYHSEDSNMPY